MKLFLLALFLPLAGAINCDVDEDLSDATEYSYTLAVAANNMTYWKSYHLNFEVYGSFSEDEVSDATVTAGYYTAEDDLVYSVSIDCATSTWTSTVSDKSSGDSATWQTGNVTCEAGTWDLWLKVQQPFLMNWIYKGEPLQKEETKSHRVGYGLASYTRTRPLKVPTKFGAHKGRTYKVETSAALSRFTFGECISYPSELSCTDAKSWVINRSKLKSGLHYFGANILSFQPKCTDLDYFQHVQTAVHSDRNSRIDQGQKDGISQNCCCVDMITGKVYDNDQDTYCMPLSGNYDNCLEQCRVTFDSSLYNGTEYLYEAFENYYETELDVV